MDDYFRALSALQSLDPGCEREQWVRIGMAAKAAGLTLDDFGQWSAGAANYAGEKDCRQAWQSFSDGPVKSGTLYSMAFAAGWQDPAKGRNRGQGTRQAARATPKPKATEKAAPRPNPAASDLWARCEPASADHPYIVAKCGRPDGLRKVGAGETATIAGQSVAGWLVVPVLSLDGELRTLN